MNSHAIICRIKNVRSHSNADRVQLGDACNFQVVVGLDVKEGDLGIYFPTDTCLGKDFAEANPELLSYFGKNLRVKTQSFRGEKSEGFWCGWENIPDTFAGVPDNLKEGTKVSTYLDCEICKKYINPETLLKRGNYTNKAKKYRTGSLSTFQKHVDTEQLRYKWDKIISEGYVKLGIWTAKLHGTSQRVANALVERELSWIERILTKLGVKIQSTEYQYLVGTRNVILGELKPDGTIGKDSFHSDEFRIEAAKPFIGKLNKGEVVYYEVVGYSAHDKPIMGTIKVTDKKLKDKYGVRVTYTYGCANGEHDIYVYRIAQQTEDGLSIDLTWDQVKERCKELDVKHVPEFPVVNDLKWIQDAIEIADPIDKSHPLEGVVLRLEGSKPKFYKEKSFTFKILEGIIKDSNQIDLEDAS